MGRIYNADEKIEMLTERVAELERAEATILTMIDGLAKSITDLRKKVKK